MKRKIALSLIILLILLFSQYKLLLTSYARFFSVNNATIGADALVVLSGGQITRVPHSINLYSKGYGKRLLLTSTRSLNSEIFNKLYPTPLQFAKMVANDFNVPVNIEVVPSLKNGATSTLDEAHDLLSFCMKEDLNHLTLVTDDFHTRRAFYAFEKVFRDSRIKLEISGAKNDVFNETNWWQTDQGIGAYALEFIKFVVYLFTSQNISFIKND